MNDEDFPRFDYVKEQTPVVAVRVTADIAISATDAVEVAIRAAAVPPNRGASPAIPARELHYPNAHFRRSFRSSSNDFVLVAYHRKAHRL
jgi:hypothetical protein